MGSNNGNSNEVLLPMLEIEQSDFIREEREKLKLALLEVDNRIMGSSRTAKPLIQRVPLALGAFKLEFEKYFEPTTVALGPLHHGKLKFEKAEQTKRKFAALFARENETNDLTLFHKIMEEIKDLKECYNPKDIENYNDERLAWMFFVDGCAVLYAAWCSLEGQFMQPHIQADLLVYFHLDLIFLENQLPYRVLKILISSSTHPQRWEQSIAQLIDSMANGKYDAEYLRKRDGQDYAHLLQQLRTQLLTGERENCSSSVIGSMLLRRLKRAKDDKTVTSIMDLKDSGIHVRPSKTNNLVDLSFHCNFSGILKMPPLMVDDSTAFKFMNLVALESCPDFENDHEVTTYLCFLGSLIQTAEDVKELRVRGMLHNYLGTMKKWLIFFVE